MHWPLKFGLMLELYHFLSESREGSGETVRMNSLVCAFTACICDKDQTNSHELAHKIWSNTSSTSIL